MPCTRLRHWSLLHRYEQELQELRPYREGLDQHAIIAVTDARGTITQVNEMFCQLSGYDRDELIGQSHRLLNSGHHPRAFFVAMWRAIAAGQVWRAEVCNRAKDGRLYWVDTAIVPGLDPRTGERRYISIRTDISERKRMEADLLQAAYTDALTGLDNRSSVMRRVHETAREAGSRPFAVLMLGLDHFRRVNDTLGHHHGDALLCTVARRLEAALPDSGHCGRACGDQFVILIERLDNGSAEIERFCSALQAALAEPVLIGGVPLVLSTSIGVVVSGNDPDATTLLRDAEAAMIEAKRSGRARHVVYDDAMRTAFQRVTRLACDLPQALAEGQVHLAFQPIVHSSTGQIAGMEALARWHHPVLGPISPAEFIPIAEQTGLVVELGRHVLQRACLGLAECQEILGLRAPRYVSVNVSRVQLQPHRGLVDDVQRALADSGLPSRCLQLEITETAAFQEDAMNEVLRALQGLGVPIALDDFGTGYSSLACLEQMPLAAVKLDRRFIVELREGSTSWAILQACLALSSALGFDTVAEGIETHEQADALQRLGCGLQQGFHFARPMGLEDLIGWCRQRPAPLHEKEREVDCEA